MRRLEDTPTLEKSERRAHLSGLQENASDHTNKVKIWAKAAKVRLVSLILFTMTNLSHRRRRVGTRKLVIPWSYWTIQMKVRSINHIPIILIPDLY